MKRFLKLCEKYDPINEDSINASLWVQQYLHESEIPFSIDDDDILLETPYGKARLKVVSFNKEMNEPEEDEQIDASTGTYVIDKEVEKLGDKAKSGLAGRFGKAFGTSAQKAKAAVKKRENLAKQAVDAYEKGTQRIEKGLQRVKSSGIKSNY
jgi:ribosomal protein L37AE/L43A